jgi:hypothetical protein
VKGSLKFNPRNRSKKNGYISKSLFLFWGINALYSIALAYWYFI